MSLLCVVGPVALSTPCKLIAPGVAVAGTMAVTKSEMYFEIDEDSEENKKIDPKVNVKTGGIDMFTSCYICVLCVKTDKTCSVYSR